MDPPIVTNGVVRASQQSYFVVLITIAVAHASQPGYLLAQVAAARPGYFLDRLVLVIVVCLLTCYRNGRANPNKLCFFDLPAEIRLLIYKLVHVHHSKSSRNSHTSHLRWYYRGSNTLLQVPNHRLFQEVMFHRLFQEEMHSLGSPFKHVRVALEDWKDWNILADGKLYLHPMRHLVSHIGLHQLSRTL
jgi:hypothetical protein